jgi:AcrR family transcriptional regulator
VSSTNSKARILDAALSLIARRGDARVTMADIAKAARVSRQGIYLHFADRAVLMLELVRHVDGRRGIEAEVEKLRRAPSGVAAMRAMVSMQARLNPGVWAVARALDAVRRTDAAAERGWQDRLANRLKGCRAIIARLAADGALRPGLDESEAADLLWTLTSLRTWEDLVLERGWSAAQYEARVTSLLLAVLTAGAGTDRRRS